MKLSKSKIVAWCVCFPVIAIIAVALIVGNCVLYSYEDTITSYLCPPIVDEQAAAAARASGQELSNQIVREASVLVKNDNKTLPLDKDADGKVNVFGWSQTDWVFGGSGSGRVFEEGKDNLSNTAGILEALTEYGIEYNTDLTAFYKKYRARMGDGNSIGVYQRDFYKLCEPPISAYGDALLNSAKSYSDTALVVISRRAGETEDPTRVQYKEKIGTDNDRTYLEISTEEEEMLRYVGANFEKTVVIVNSTNVIELGFLESIAGLDACLVVGATGTNGAHGIPPVLYGKYFAVDEDGNETETLISPSGKFADTYAYEFESNVNYRYTGDAGVGHYTGISGEKLYPEGDSRNAGEQYTTATYIDYVEGIYLGYKWYETADVMGLWNGKTRAAIDPSGTTVTKNDYEAVVQYPFGFGMSYTSFDWEIMSFKLDGEEVSSGASFTEKSKIEITVKVTNTGEYSGMDVVEVYLTPPYNPKNLESGGIEKSHVMLVGFAKTFNLEKGGSQDLTIELDPYEFASYDCYDANQNGFEGYELEAGDYQIKLMTDSHNVKKVKKGGDTEDGVFTLKVTEDIKLRKDKYTGADVVNRFTGDSAVETEPIDGSAAATPVEYISRKSFPDPYTFKRTPDRAMTAAEKEYNLYNSSYANAWNNAEFDIVGNPVDKSPVTWNSGGSLKVYENGALTELGNKLAADYDAPEWKSVLDQVSISEALALAENGAFNNAAVPSIGKPRLTDYDGPSQVRSFNAGSDKGTGFPCSGTMSQTWSKSLVYSFGLNYGKEMDALGVNGAYAFGCNLHRSPFAGRNYEYLSEDGFLTAELLTQEVKGLKNIGKYTYLKHLILGEVEHDRDAMYTWLTEQALREIYLKPFQMAVEQGGCVGIMSSYNRIANVWTGGCETLITGILRNEWGFNGSIVTDYSDRPKYMCGDHSVRAGGDLSMNAKFHYGTINESAVKENPRLAHQLREVVHHVTYAFLSAQYANANYNADEDVDAFYSSSATSSWVWWKPLLACIDILVFAGAAIGLYFLIMPRYVITGKRKAAAASGEIDITSDTAPEQNSETAETQDTAVAAETAVQTEQVARAAERSRTERKKRNGGQKDNGGKNA